MNFTKFDFKLIISTATALVILTVALSSLGMTSEQVGAEDFPEMDIETDRFGFALDYPDDPSGSTEATLVYTSDNPNDVCSYSGSPADHSAWVYRETGSNGNTIDGTQVTWLPTVESCDEGFENASMEATIGEFRQDGNWLDTYTLSPGESVEHRNGSTEIFLQYADRQVTDDEFRAELEFEVLSHAHVENETFADSIIDAAVRGILLLGWFMTFAFELVTNFVYLMFTVVSYITTLLYFLLNTYLTVATSVPTAWQAFTLLPGIILSLEIGKMVYIAISIIR